MHWETHGVFFKCAGEMTDADLRGFNRSVYRHERFAEMRYQLCDFLEVTKMSVTPAGVREASAEDSEASQRNPHVRVAIVTQSPLIFGLARMYASYGFESHWETQIFDSMAEGRAWVHAWEDSLKGESSPTL